MGCAEIAYMDRFVTNSAPACLVSLACLAAAAVAGPQTSPWPVAGPDDTSGVAAAAYSGWYATADSFENNVEIRDAWGNLRTTISHAQIATLVPWMSLDGGPDGPGALAWSASGRLLYIVVHDDTVPGDGQPSDAVLRFDAGDGSLTLFTRLEVFGQGNDWAHAAACHQRGRLYVGTIGGGVKVYSAFAGTTQPVLLATLTPGGSTNIRGLSVDRENDRLFVATDSTVYRASLSTFPPTTFTPIANVPGIRGLAWTDTYSAGQRGLHILSSMAGLARVDYIPTALTGGGIVTPVAYASSTQAWHDIAATADGALLIAADEDALRLTDTTDTLLSLDAWMQDEFAQIVTLGKGLMTPDCGLPGLVIDADTDSTISRFHPASPDAAAWVVLLLIMNDHLQGDSEALGRVQSILSRYAGLAPGPGVTRSADGIYIHWINPCTGGPATGGCGCTPGNWGTEYATLSTMKIVAAAARAMAYWPDDPVIARAASRIIFRTRNWDAYIQGGTDALFFVGAAAGGPVGGAARPFHEGIIFVEQAGVYGSDYSRSAADRWFNRSLWPTATYLLGRPITSTSSGLFEAAFISLYPALLQPRYRADAGWRAQVQNIRWSNAAWTDDNAPRFYTVFSAGTTRSDWGGYNADSLGNHPGNLTTFPSLLALCASGDGAEAVAGYQAYRKGGRQTFRTGASFLYRRSDIDRGYLPNSAGLPDVALGALGLAEVISPGSIDAVLARPYPVLEMCPVDVNADGAVTIDDAYSLTQSPQDLNGDGVADAKDAACLINWVRRHERPASP
jgi:hypothetical protein